MTRQRFLKQHEKNIEIERSAGIIKDYAKISQVNTPCEQLNNESTTSQYQRASNDTFMKPSGRRCQLMTSTSQKLSLVSPVADTRAKTSGWLNIVEEKHPTTEIFRVPTASALNVSRSINRQRVSQRLFDIQNETKMQGTKI